MKKIYLISFFIFSLLLNSFSQTVFDSNSKDNKLVVGTKYVYEFRDGTTLIGKFIKQESGNIYIINEKGGKETYIPEVMVSNVYIADSSNVINGEYRFPNLHDSRYFFAPSAFGLEKGEGYYSTSYFILWQAQIGISDNFSIGGGMTPLGTPILLNFKLTSSLGKKSNIAYGWLYVYERIESEALLNMPFIVYTYGTKENNITSGFGLSFVGSMNNSLGREDVVLNIASVQRISRRFAFVFETFLFNAFLGKNVELLGGPGLRYFRKINRVSAKNGAGSSTWDIQFLKTSILNDGNGFIPMIGKSWKF